MVEGHVYILMYSEGGRSLSVSSSVPAAEMSLSEVQSHKVVRRSVTVHAHVRHD